MWVEGLGELRGAGGRSFYFHGEGCLSKCSLLSGLAVLHFLSNYGIKKVV